MVKIDELGKVFKFKEFSLLQEENVMRVSTDSILLGSWTFHTSNDQILDIGTGSGILALMMAQKYPKAKISGIELQPVACDLARRNVRENNLQDSIQIIQSDFGDFETHEVFEIIISNPPFYNRKDLFDQSIRQGIRNALSLPHGILLKKVSALLSPNGVFTLILPCLEGTRFIELAEQYSIQPIEIVEVVSKEGLKPNRILLKMVKSFEPVSCTRSLMIIRDKQGNYTEAYKDLTKTFYL